MKRFFCPPENIEKNNIVIKDESEVHHIKDVLRLRCDDVVAIFDGRGREYEAQIAQIRKDRIALKVQKKKKMQTKKSISITLACAIPRAGRFDYILEKCTELGVDSIIPLETKRTIVSLKDKQREIKLKHWRKIAISASKQCKGSVLPEILPVNSFSQAMERAADYDLCLFFSIESRQKQLKDSLRSFKKGKVLVFIGPEGDFTQEEIALAKKSNCVFVGLGERILRVDTAAITVVGILNFIFANEYN